MDIICYCVIVGGVVTAIGPHLEAALRQRPALPLFEGDRDNA